MLNWFGSCKWDAFYTNVTAEGVKQGLESLESGGISPKFIIVDDGWQSVGMDLTSTETKADDSAKYVKIIFMFPFHPKFTHHSFLLQLCKQVDSYQREPQISKKRGR